MHRNGLSTEVLLEHLDITGVEGRITEQQARILRRAGVGASVVRRMRSIDDSSANDPVRKRGRSRSGRQPRTADRQVDSDSNPTRPGTLLLKSRSTKPVWFRRDPRDRTLVLSGTERSSMPSLSNGDGIELSMEPGAWMLKTPDVKDGHQVQFTPGRTGRLIIVGRSSKGVNVRWQPNHPAGNERQLVLLRQQLGVEQVTNALRTQREHADRERRRATRFKTNPNRTGRRSFGRGGFSVTRRRGRARSPHYGYSPLFNTHFYLPGCYYFYRPHRQRRFHHHRHRSHGVDFHLDLNHDFEADGRRGSLRLRTGRSYHRDPFFYFD